MEPQTRRKLLLVLLGVGAIGLGLYAILTFAAGNSKMKNKSGMGMHFPWGAKNSSNKSFNSFIRTAEYKQAVAKLSYAIHSESESGTLSANSLLNLNRLVIELIKGEFLTKYKKSREQRREVLSDLQAYFQEYSRGVYECEDILESGLSQVLNDFDLDFEFYDEQYQKMCLENPNFATLINLNLERMKAELSVSKRSTSVEKVLDMFKFQLEIADKFDFSSISEIPVDLVVVLKQSYIGDLASIKFGVEEEDLILNEEVLKDPRIEQLQKIIQAKLNYEQQKLINFPY